MDETLLKFLDCGNWDSVRLFKKVPIRIFVDPNGGTWDLVAPKGPCGCCPETMQNAFRTFFWCPKHPDKGALAFGYREGEWFWVDPKMNRKGE